MAVAGISRALIRAVKGASYKDFTSKFRENYSKNAILSRIANRKKAAKDPELNHFIQEAIRLRKQPQIKGAVSGKQGLANQTKYDDNFLKMWSDIANRATPEDLALINSSLAQQFGKGMPRQFLYTLNKSIKKNKNIKDTPTFIPNITRLSLDNLRDEGALVAVNNLKNYNMKNIDIDPTGQFLPTPELKKIMWPGKENKKYLDAWQAGQHGGTKPDVSIQPLVKNIKDKEIGFGNEFTPGFDQFGGMGTTSVGLGASKNQTLKEILKATNKTFSQIQRSSQKLSTKDILGGTHYRTMLNLIKKTRAEASKLPEVQADLPTYIARSIRSNVGRMLFGGFKQNPNATINSIMKNVDKFDAKKFATLANKQKRYDDMLETYKKLNIEGFDPVNPGKFSKKLDLGHLRALMENYKLGLQMDNLFLQDAKINISQGGWTRRVLKTIDNLENSTNPIDKQVFKNKLTKELLEGEQKGYTAKIKEYTVGDVSKYTPYEDLESAMLSRIHEVTGLKDGGLIQQQNFASGGIARLGIKMLERLAKKMPEEDFLKLTETLWKGVDPKKSGRYRAWAKNRWSPGYRWPYERSRIRGRDIEKSHFASLSPAAKKALRKRFDKQIAEYIARKKD